jgi:hypothetical protein
MTEVSISPVVPHDVENRAESGNAAPGMARWLGLAAAPTFAIMALWNGLFSGEPNMLCIAMQGSSPMSGMTVMYLLMSAFHLSPWLKLISSRRSPAWSGVLSSESLTTQGFLLHSSAGTSGIATSGTRGRPQPVCAGIVASSAARFDIGKQPTTESSRR